MPAFDAATTPNEGSGTSVSFSHTVTGTNPYLQAGISHDGGSARSLTGTYNSVSMTLKADLNRVSFLDLAAPTTGSNTVALAWTGSASFVAGSISLTGVDQVTPSSTAQTANGTSTTPAVTVTSVSGDWVSAWVGINSGGDLTSLHNERIDSAGAGSSRRLGVFDSIAVASTTVMTCTSAGFESWSAAGCVVTAAAATIAKQKIRRSINNSLVSGGLIQ